MNTPSASVAHLLGLVTGLEVSVRAAVSSRRAVDPAPDDPFRGLYLGDQEIDRLLDGRAPLEPAPAWAELRAEVEARADVAEATGADLRLRRLCQHFGLEPLDLDILLVALAPDLDSRFERFYGYLHDDVTRRRASVGLALELCGRSAPDGAARERLMPGGPLVDNGLVDVGDLDRPLLSRALQVPDRVTAHLLDSDQPDADVAMLQEDAVSPAGDPTALIRALTTGSSLCYLRERPGSSGRALATAALDQLGLGTFAVDLERLSHADDPVAMARRVGREAGLRGGGLVAGPVAALEERGPVHVRAWAELPGPVFLTGRSTWDPCWSRVVPVVVDVGPPTGDERVAMWAAAVNGASAAGLDPATATRHFRLTPEQIVRAATAAGRLATLEGTELDAAHLRAGARSQNGAGLERRARRIEPVVGWDDLVLPVASLAALHELAARARHRDQVIDEWGMRPGGGRGRGVTALFAGDSGTGKTMSAEVVAGELGLDLYAVDLAAVVDKYVGETEKNLERIFSEADGVNAVLLFDEADAIFGKRSGVSDAHDRYANIEVAYLLQRMESFDGLAILSTNLRANLDEAFLRRLDAVLDFPVPDEERRLRLWDRSLGERVDRDHDVDLGFCARQFELTGGNIRSIVITAAYFAAVEGGPVTMLQLVRATQREYRKLGRLCVKAEFGDWFEHVMTDESIMSDRG